MSALTLIVAATVANGIGQSGRLPWQLPLEMAYFKRITTTAPDGDRNAVLMGRNTWESIPPRFRPLAGRVNVVLSSDTAYSLGGGPKKAQAVLHADLDGALAALDADVHRRFVIGGAHLYAQCLARPALVERVLLTRILAPDFAECDVALPALGALGMTGWTRATHAALQAWAGFAVPEGEQTEAGVVYEFQMWVRE